MRVQFPEHRLVIEPRAKTVRQKVPTGAPKDNFPKNICTEDDLRSRIFGTFVAKFLACLLLLLLLLKGSLKHYFFCQGRRGGPKRGNFRGGEGWPLESFFPRTSIKTDE